MCVCVCVCADVCDILHFIRLAFKCCAIVTN